LQLPTRGKADAIVLWVAPCRKEVRMNGQMRAGIAALAIALPLALSAKGNAATLWVCNVPNEGTVVFVTAADAARHGIDTANARAGTVFHDQFGETCHVESG
jgi:hypothetical protein